MDALKQFSKKQYLNLETFRKNGEGVKTPVWFAQEGEALYVMTQPSTGKAKRIRNNGRANVAPCKMDGTLTGDWVAAQARQMNEDDCEQVEKLFNKKYGLLKKLFSLPNARKGLKDIYIEVVVENRE